MLFVPTLQIAMTDRRLKSNESRALSLSLSGCVSVDAEGTGQFISKVSERILLN